MAPISGSGHGTGEMMRARSEDGRRIGKQRRSRRVNGGKATAGPRLDQYKVSVGATPCLVEHRFRRGWREFSQSIRNDYEIMFLARKTGAQIFLQPLRLPDYKRLALLSHEPADGDPAGIGLKQCGLSKLRKLFGRSEQRCTRPSAEIEQAENFRLWCAQLDFCKNARDSSIISGQSHCKISRTMRFRKNGRRREVSFFVLLGKIRDGLCKPAPVCFVDLPLNGILQFGGEAHRWSGPQSLYFTEQP